MEKKTKGKKDIMFCIETFNDLDETKVHIEGGTVDIMSVVAMAMFRDKDLMDMMVAIVSSVQKFQLIEGVENRDN